MSPGEHQLADGGDERAAIVQWEQGSERAEMSARRDPWLRYLSHSVLRLNSEKSTFTSKNFSSRFSE